MISRLALGSIGITISIVSVLLSLGSCQFLYYGASNLCDLCAPTDNGRCSNRRLQIVEDKTSKLAHLEEEARDEGPTSNNGDSLSYDDGHSKDFVNVLRPANSTENAPVIKARGDQIVFITQNETGLFGNTDSTWYTDVDSSSNIRRLWNNFVYIGGGHCRFCFRDNTDERRRLSTIDDIDDHQGLVPIDHIDDHGRSLLKNKAIAGYWDRIAVGNFLTDAEIELEWRLQVHLEEIYGKKGGCLDSRNLKVEVSLAAAYVRFVDYFDLDDLSGECLEIMEEWEKLTS